MKSTIENIYSKLDEIESGLRELLDNYTKIEPVNKPGDSLVFMSLEGNHWFKKLPSEAKSLQNRLYKSFGKVTELVDVLLANQMQEFKEKFNDLRQSILKLIEQKEAVWEEEISKWTEAFKGIKEILSHIYSSDNEVPIIVPDTNILYHNPNIETWDFEGFSKFKIIVTTNVLADLDKHKVEHRNEEVRKKALKLINRFKEYRRRGKLIEGVNVVANKIVLQTRAVEPNFKSTLTWLNESNPDDRLLAEHLDILREFANHPVFLLTNDINLQNKCEFAELAYMELS